MRTRFTLIMLGSASFLMTLALSAWHEGLWERLAEPVAVTRTALSPVPAPQPVVKADSSRAHPVFPDPAPAATPVAAAMPEPAPTDDSRAAPDPVAPEALERQQQERHGEAARGARTR